MLGDFLLVARRNALRTMFVITAILLFTQFESVKDAHAASCMMTAAQVAAVDALPDPIKKNATGAFIRNGKVMEPDEVLDMCLTRRLYDLMLEREAKGAALRFSEAAGMQDIRYLSVPECARLNAHAGRVTLTPADKIAKIDAECKKSAGRAL
jgi:hypothetical protein